MKSKSIFGKDGTDSQICGQTVKGLNPEVISKVGDFYRPGEHGPE